MRHPDYPGNEEVEQIPRPKDTAPLQAHISWYVREGYVVQSQTETSAQLVKPKSFSAGWAIFWFLIFGIGLIIYILYYMSLKDLTVYLSVEGGKVRSV